jgi:hypothetical protein
VHFNLTDGWPPEIIGVYHRTTAGCTVSLRLVVEMLGLPPLGSIDEVAFVLHLIQRLLVSVRSNPSANRFYEISNGDHHASGSH